MHAKRGRLSSTVTGGERSWKHHLMAGASIALFCAGALAGSASASSFKVLYAFCAKTKCRDGSGPSSTLLRDSAGNLYGTTESGGTGGGADFGGGTVYRLSPSSNGSWAERVLYSFCSQPNCSDGKTPGNGALIIDEAGNLYGTTSTGGKGPVAFELSPNKNPNRPWKLTILHTFCLANDGPCGDGDEPNGPLSYAGSETGAPYDGKSPLYGTTEAGGANARGTVFSLTPTASGWSETVLHDFCSQAECFDGESPDGNLIVGNDAMIGITNFGGAFSPGGTVFQLTRKGSSWSDQILYSFCAKTNCTDGRYPTGGLFADSSGTLYGAFGAGGANAPYGGGTFRLTAKNQHWKYKRLNSFCGGSDCPKGTRPEGGVVADSAGAIYGTTIDGGIDRNGVVYEVAGTHTRVLHKFCSEPGCADGGQPEGSLIIDGSGRLYGTASIFGAYGDVHFGGVVFEIRP